MKKFLVICLALVMGTGICLAQKPAKKAHKQLTTTVFSTDLDCPNCAKKVETNVPALGKGIEDLQIDIKKREVTVVYDAAKNRLPQAERQGFGEGDAEAEIAGTARAVLRPARAPFL